MFTAGLYLSSVTGITPSMCIHIGQVLQLMPQKAQQLGRNGKTCLESDHILGSKYHSSLFEANVFIKCDNNSSLLATITKDFRHFPIQYYNLQCTTYQLLTFKHLSNEILHNPNSVTPRGRVLQT